MIVAAHGRFRQKAKRVVKVIRGIRDELAEIQATVQFPMIGENCAISKSPQPLAILVVNFYKLLRVKTRHCDFTRAESGDRSWSSYRERILQMPGGVKHLNCISAAIRDYD